MSQTAKFIIGASILGLTALVLWGWVWNVVKIFEIASDPVTGMFLLRLAGVVIAPLGAVLGFI